MEKLINLNSERRMLTREEEQSLLSRWKDGGDPRARDQLLRSFAPFLRKIAWPYVARMPQMEEDILQHAAMGFLKAVDKFDPSFGVGLGTYARHWVREFVSYACLRMASITKGPIPLVLRLQTAVRKLPGCLDITGAIRPEKVAELAVLSGISEARILPVWEYRRVMARHVSLNMPAFHDEGNEEEIMNLLPDDGPTTEEQVADEDERQFTIGLLNEGLSVLSERERMVVLRRSADPPDTLEAISKELGVSRERVRQIESKALRKMRARILDRSRPRVEKAAISDFMKGRGAPAMSLR